MSGEVTKRSLPRTGYPRRRAVTACEVCRERKKRCDNTRPSCSFCQTIGVHCEYRGRDDSSFDPSSLAILDRLAVLEALMRQHNCASVPPAPSAHFHPSPPAALTPGSRAEQDPPQQPQAPPPASLWELHTGAESRVRLDSVLKWPVFEVPLSSVRRHPFLTFKKEQDYTYLDDMLHTATPLRTSVSSLSISTLPSEVERLIDRFFVLVHVKNPILDRATVKQYCHEYCENGPTSSLRSCLILLICALASVAPEVTPSRPLGPDHGRSRSRPVGGEDLAMGECYFAEVEKLLGASMTQHNSLAVQCLCLAGMYHMYMVNTMAGHAMFHNAGYIMQMLACKGQNTLEESSQIGSSLYWTCFKSEREIFAEIPIAIPALGRPSQTSSYPLPPQERFMTWSGSNDSWAQAEEDSWYFFLSEIAMRRIIDKVAEDVGNIFLQISASPISPVQVVLEEFSPVATELERQAFVWREHLPTNMRFPDPPTPASTEWMLYSRQPFYRTLELMHRPFLFAYIHGRAGGPLVRDFANKALRYAQQYLQGCHPTHAHHGRALQLRNELKMVVMLFAASRSGLEMPYGWYEDVRAVIRSFKYWQPTVPFMRSYIEVVLALDRHFKGSDADCTSIHVQDVDMCI